MGSSSEETKLIIPVNKLPSGFKPYPFKSFKMKAMSLQNAIDLGSHPTLTDLTNFIQGLVGDEIDASLLVPIDVKYLIAMLAFHAFPKQSWTLNLVCPHCQFEHKRSVTMKDFPPVPSLSEKDPYPLTIDDGKHVWEIGYASVASMDALTDKDKITKDTDTGEFTYTGEYLDLVEPYILAVDGSKDGIRQKLLDIEDFTILSLMVEAIKKYFTSDTYSEMECPQCKKKYKVPMSAVEVTQYTPFLDKTTVGKYKTNFRL